MATQEGKPIYIESLLSIQEYKLCSKKYPNTYNSDSPRQEFECEFKWRRRMGASLLTSEIESMNKGLEVLRKWVVKQRENQ